MPATPSPVVVGGGPGKHHFTHQVKCVKSVIAEAFRECQRTDSEGRKPFTDHRVYFHFLIENITAPNETQLARRLPQRRAVADGLETNAPFPAGFLQDEGV